MMRTACGKGVAPTIVQKNRRYYANRLRAVLPGMDFCGACILDLGCGEMLLRSMLPADIANYHGIDCWPASQSEAFTCGDLREIEWDNRPSDYIFLLGVIDHLSRPEARLVLERCRRAFSKKLVVSQATPLGSLLGLKGSSGRFPALKQLFTGFECDVRLLMKLPLCQRVWDLTHAPLPLRKLATERVWIISR
ncbi:MAG: class I SAM-dependent methyltransferase [Saprospiraceae bacterium]|nr:class I SAM-dependent methyltransferase [Saprospiraceae bacterium]